MTGGEDPIRITITIDGNGISTASSGIEAVQHVSEGIESAVPAPARFGGAEVGTAGSAEDVPAIHDAEPAPARFRPSSP